MYSAKENHHTLFKDMRIRTVHVVAEGKCVSVCASEARDSADTFWTSFSLQRLVELGGASLMQKCCYRLFVHKVITY